ncbi:MAG: TrmH family RNA methyltransferase, partial [Spirochaetota bacterium]
GMTGGTGFIALAAMIFGNEATGLSQTLREYVDAIVAIPMRGTVNSLNLASALSVTLYEIDRRRR